MAKMGNALASNINKYIESERVNMRAFSFNFTFSRFLTYFVSRSHIFFFLSFSPHFMRFFSSLFFDIFSLAVIKNRCCHRKWVLFGLNFQNTMRNTESKCDIDFFFVHFKMCTCIQIIASTKKENELKNNWPDRIPHRNGIQCEKQIRWKWKFSN